MSDEESTDIDQRTSPLQELKGRSAVNARRSLKGHITAGRDSWVSVKPCDVILFVGDEPEWLEAKGRQNDHDPIKLEFRTPNRRAFKMELTSMTGPELRALMAFFDRAFNMALPVCEELDVIAKEAFEAGDDTYVRLYRPDPIIYVREKNEDGKRFAVPMKVEKNEVSDL